MVCTAYKSNGCFWLRARYFPRCSTTTYNTLNKNSLQNIGSTHSFIHRAIKMSLKVVLLIAIDCVPLFCDKQIYI